MNYFFITFFTILLLSNIFVIRQTVKYIFTGESRPYALIIFILIAVLLFVYQIFGSYFAEKFPYAVNNILSYIVYYYLAFLVYGVLLYGTVFVINIFLKNFIPFNLYKTAFALIFVILAAGTYYKHSTVITEYEIKSNDIKPLDIVLVSDVHLGYINGTSSLDKMNKMINDLNPDIVLIAGDLVDMELKPVVEKNMLEKLKDIKSRYGVFFATGNHDIYGRKADEITRILRENGIFVLRDEKVLVNDELYIAGRDNFSRTPISEIVSQNPENQKPVIILQHTPDTIFEAAENNIFMQVSGHTHKGQLFPGRLFTKRIFPLDYGLKKFDNTNVIVSSGYGTWGPPVRVGSRSEICLIKIR